MSIFGSNFGAGAGEINRHVADIKITGNMVSFLPATGFGNMYYGIHVNNLLYTSVYAVEGQYTTPVSVFCPSGSYIIILGLGQIDNNPNLYIFNAEDINQRFVLIKWMWPYSILDPDDAPNITGIILTGILRKHLDFSTTGKKTRGLLSAVVEAGDGLRMTIYSADGTELCTGIGEDVITLTEVGGSGVSGSFTQLPGPYESDTFNVTVRYAAGMMVRRGTVNPPVSAIANVSYNNDDFRLWTETTILDNGTYYYALQPFSDTEILGIQGTAHAVTVLGAPEPVSKLMFEPTGINYEFSFTASPSFPPCVSSSSSSSSSSGGI